VAVELSHDESFWRALDRATSPGSTLTDVESVGVSEIFDANVPAASVTSVTGSGSARHPPIFPSCSPEDRGIGVSAVFNPHRLSSPPKRSAWIFFVFDPDEVPGDVLSVLPA
jgi:hypothetical protein